MSNLLALGPLVGSALFVVLAAVFVAASGMVRYIGNNRVAVVEKLWSRRGSIAGGLIALKEEAGFQPDVLRGGLHFFFPFQYRLHVQSLVTIPQGRIGYVFARDGAPLEADQTLATHPTGVDFQDARKFLEAGGQKGPQRKILREGAYAINLAQFVVVTKDRTFALSLERSEADLLEQMAEIIEERGGFEPVVIKDADDQIGVITVHDGPGLPAGELIAPLVGADPDDPATFHNSFQEAGKFLAAGGRKGRQLQVLVEGTYYINRLFATVERINKTVVEVGQVGVVVSYTGALGADTSGEGYRHGELVANGERGVWRDPLLPGKYAFNTYAGRVTMVPTTNFILKWETMAVGSHKFDENLAEVSLITRDAFEPTLPVSVVVHIDYRKAPLVIQRFGDIKKLVEQTLDPMVSAYFKNIGQTRTLIELLQDRSAIQGQSSEEMKAKFGLYNLELQEVLIGTPRPAASGDDQIEKILTQLRQRQIADEQIGTYERQKFAAQKERELREAEALAKQQTAITESQLSIQVQQNAGKASLARSEQEAQQRRTLAKAEADATRLLGEGEAGKVVALARAEAEKVTKVGLATAEAIASQVEASGGARYQLARQVAERFAEALETSGVDVVPKVSITGAGGEGGANGGVMQALLTLLMSEKLGLAVDATDQRVVEAVEG
ncbi:SPFH domain-containing protein [Caulobacter sp. BK020]|uniref:SPFH domain-containing protein n=1 Tax=Caulobacter sp. BK020 TaxID=2512117 RepID=UPI0010454C0A|nr:SPFH domain-containing protein [Caulobacter sp. BK020]TCS13135.1 putative membrane protein YqiK [Caulobacter sp. BK020]